MRAPTHFFSLLVVAVLGGSCRDPDAPASPRAPQPSATPTAMNPTTTPDLSLVPPTPDELAAIADAITAAVPEAHRAAVRGGLVAEILPWRLIAPRDATVRRKQLAAVQEALIARLSVGDPQAALAIVRCEAQGQRLLRTALGLATRRYLLDHPATRAPAGWDDTLATAPLDRAALVARATEVQREASAALETTTGDCREALRLDAVHARLAAGSAATGSFATAAGSLVDFLRAVGESPSVLDIH
jgi:hypothetical protein